MTNDIRDSDIYREIIIHPWEDANLDDDSLRATFAADPCWCRRQPDPVLLAGWSCLAVGAALAILALVWLVTT